jgi:hypothetical protein
MTRQYLAGELSLLLARVSVEAADPASVEVAVRLRHLAETVPIAELGGIVVRALGLTDSLCWESLEQGDVTAFTRQAEMGAGLHEFGVCARLLGDT